MSVTLNSTRFGPLELPEEAVLEFPTGLIGLDGSRYALLAGDDDPAFVWLQSLDDPQLAIPVTDPWRFFPSYEVELSDEEAERTGIEDATAASVYVTVCSAECPQDFCANLAAPILIAGGRGHQVINQAPDTPLRAPLIANPADSGGQKARAA